MKYVAPAYQEDAFNCPHCEAYAHQQWAKLWNDTRKAFVRRLSISVCTRCKEFSLWLDDKMVYPAESSAPLPVEDMPSDVKADFTEARNIVNASPRAAAALLRLALQKLMLQLGEKGKDLNDDIGNLVTKGLPEKTQKALDAVRCIGNEAIHPGRIDLRDDIDTASALFGLLNQIVERMITQPKKIDEIYSKIPDTAKKAIEERDRKI